MIMMMIIMIEIEFLLKFEMSAHSFETLRNASMPNAFILFISSQTELGTERLVIVIYFPGS